MKRIQQKESQRVDVKLLCNKCEKFICKSSDLERRLSNYTCNDPAIAERTRNVRTGCITFRESKTVGKSKLGDILWGDQSPTKILCFVYIRFYLSNVFEIHVSALYTCIILINEEKNCKGKYDLITVKLKMWLFITWLLIVMPSPTKDGARGIMFWGCPYVPLSLYRDISRTTLNINCKLDESMYHHGKAILVDFGVTRSKVTEVNLGHIVFIMR